MTVGNLALYVYAITRSCDVDLSDLPAVADGSRPRMYVHNGLGLVVSDIAPDELASVPTDDFSEGGTLAGLARTHDQVVRAVAEQTAALPLRFGTVLADTAAAAELLDERAETARDLLALVDGHREWGVRLRAAAPKPSAPAETAATGTEYLTRRRKARTDAAEQHGQVQMSAEHAHETLTPWSRSSMRRTAREPDVVLDVAYLVSTDVEVDFLAATERIGVALGEQDVRLEVVGPWPPYSFAREGLAEAIHD